MPQNVSILVFGLCFIRRHFCQKALKLVQYWFSFFLQKLAKVCTVDYSLKELSQISFSWRAISELVLVGTIIIGCG